jgi:hypothetical protein
MSAYNPPDKNTSIFNPTNYTTSTTTSTINESEVIATTGAFDTLFIGGVNVATSINGKQSLIGADTLIEEFDVNTITFYQSGNTGSSANLTYNGISNITTNLTDLVDYSSRTFYAYPTYSGASGGEQTVNQTGQVVATWTFTNVENQRNLYYMEFDTTLESVAISSSTNSAVDITLLIECNIGGDNYRTKLYSYSASGAKVNDDRIRFLSLLDANNGDFNSTFIFTLTLITITGNGSLTIDANAYRHLATLKLTGIRIGDNIVATSNAQ